MTGMTLEQAAAYAEELAKRPDAERELAALRVQWDDELEAAARHADYRVRGVAFRALAQFRFRQKLELLRRGLDDESPAVRGSALIALESLSRAHPGDVNKFRPLLNELAARDPNVAVRRLAIACFKNGAADAATIRILDGIAADDEAPAEVTKAAAAVATLLLKKQRLAKK
jgi:HEAT repeat protein